MAWYISLLQDGVLKIDHDDNGINTEEGPVQQTVVVLQSVLQDYERFYASLWAVNGVNTFKENVYGASVLRNLAGHIYLEHWYLHDIFV